MRLRVGRRQGDGCLDFGVEQNADADTLVRLLLQNVVEPLRLVQGRPVQEDERREVPPSDEDSLLRREKRRHELWVVVLTVPVQLGVVAGRQREGVCQARLDVAPHGPARVDEVDKREADADVGPLRADEAAQAEVRRGARRPCARGRRGAAACRHQVRALPRLVEADLCDLHEQHARHWHHVHWRQRRAREPLLHDVLERERIGVNVHVTRRLVVVPRHCRRREERHAPPRAPRGEDVPARRRVADGRKQLAPRDRVPVGVGLLLRHGCLQLDRVVLHRRRGRRRTRRRLRRGGRRGCVRGRHRRDRWDRRRRRRRRRRLHRKGRGGERQGVRGCVVQGVPRHVAGQGCDALRRCDLRHGRRHRDHGLVRLQREPDPGVRGVRAVQRDSACRGGGREGVRVVAAAASAVVRVADALHLTEA
eukprot:Rhum_TRINITY_DN14899_c18_g1::Rhum_TRINITY_DN14899_c18_g1_i1::g.125604::m.125604